MQRANKLKERTARTSDFSQPSIKPYNGAEGKCNNSLREAEEEQELVAVLSGCARDGDNVAFAN